MSENGPPIFNLDNLSQDPYEQGLDSVVANPLGESNQQHVELFSQAESKELFGVEASLEQAFCIGEQTFGVFNISETPLSDSGSGRRKAFGQEEAGIRSYGMLEGKYVDRNYVILQLDADGKAVSSRHKGLLDGEDAVMGPGSLEDRFTYDGAVSRELTTVSVSSQGELAVQMDSSNDTRLLDRNSVIDRFGLGEQDVDGSIDERSASEKEYAPKDIPDEVRFGNPIDMPRKTPPVQLEKLAGLPEEVANAHAIDMSELLPASPAVEAEIHEPMHAGSESDVERMGASKAPEGLPVEIADSHAIDFPPRAKETKEEFEVREEEEILEPQRHSLEEWTDAAREAIQNNLEGMSQDEQRQFVRIAAKSKTERLFQDGVEQLNIFIGEDRSLPASFNILNDEFKDAVGFSADQIGEGNEELQRRIEQIAEFEDDNLKVETDRLESEIEDHIDEQKTVLGSQIQHRFEDLSYLSGRPFTTEYGAQFDPDYKISEALKIFHHDLEAGRIASGYEHEQLMYLLQEARLVRPQTDFTVELRGSIAPVVTEYVQQRESIIAMNKAKSEELATESARYLSTRLGIASEEEGQDMKRVLGRSVEVAEDLEQRLQMVENRLAGNVDQLSRISEEKRAIKTWLYRQESLIGQNGSVEIQDGFFTGEDIASIAGALHEDEDGSGETEDSERDVLDQALDGYSDVLNSVASRRRMFGDIRYGIETAQKKIAEFANGGFMGAMRPRELMGDIKTQGSSISDQINILRRAVGDDGELQVIPQNLTRSIEDVFGRLEETLVAERSQA